MSQKFAQKLRKFRTEKRVTLEQLAEALGTSKAYVWQLENKPNAKPSADLLLKVANYFEQSPEFFIDDSSDAPTENHRESAFFRKFQRLSETDQQTIEKILGSFENDPSKNT